MRAFEDGNRPEGGHAVVLLQGVADIPETAAFQISPADTSAEPGPAWPHGDHHPVQRRRTEDGVEIVIGPEVANNEFLVPGMVVSIEFPSLGLGGEVLWPNVAPLRLPKRSKLGVTRPRRLSATEHMPSPALDSEPPGEAAAVPAPESGDAQAAEPVSAGPADRGEQPTVAAAEMSEHDASWPAHGGEVPADVPVRANIRRSANGVHREPQAAQAETVAHHTRSSPPAPSSTWRSEPEQQRRPAETSPSVTETDPRQPMRTALSPATAAGLAVATAILGALAGAMLLAPERIFGSSSSHEPVPVSQSVAQQARTVAPFEASAEPGGLLFDALTAAAVSPRGVSAAGLPLSKLLENATASAISGGSPSDTEEAAFWRKRYIAGALGDDRTMRALTQLGSVYAEPSGRQPDFVRARLMWEMASAIGDPVAMCFLGQLHENGLGVAADRKAALQWYERARQAGGCPSLSESLARVRQ